MGTVAGRGLSYSTVVLPATVAAGALIGTNTLVIPCWFRTATGLACPFCGGSRMIGALLDADPVGALHYNAIGLLVVLPVLAAVLVAMVRRDFGRGQRVWPAGRAGFLAALALAVVLVAWFILRNTSLASFDTALG